MLTLSEADTQRERNIRRVLGEYRIHIGPTLRVTDIGDVLCSLHYPNEPGSLYVRMRELCAENKFKKWDIVATHGPTAYCGWREYRMRWSLQIVLHMRSTRDFNAEFWVGFDIDKWNPDYGAAPALMHKVEEFIPHLLRRKVLKQKAATDPWKVERGRWGTQIKRKHLVMDQFD